MAQKIPMSVFVGVIVVVVIAAGFIMYKKAVPPMKPEGAPSNLSQRVEALIKDSPNPKAAERYRNRKRD